MQSELVTIEKLVAGGAGLARGADGKVLLVEGALPDETVAVTRTAEHRGHDDAVVIEVTVASKVRQVPPCPHVADGCGGCDLQHGMPDAVPEMKAELVRDALRRIGRVADPAVTAGPAAPLAGGRTTLRVMLDDDGRPALRRARSHEAVTLGADGCLVAHPRLNAVLAGLVAPGADEVTVRVGARTGEAIIVVDPDAGSVVPAALDPTVRLVGRNELRAGTRAWIHEEAAGRRWRISAESFFQSGPEVAEALVAAARDAAGTALCDGVRLVDLYGGVGLFAGALAGAGDVAAAHVTVVESNASAAADARVNLADLAATVDVVRARVERWRPRAADLVVADPARRGLGAEGVATVGATGAGRLVLVSCDAAALARDVTLLRNDGWEFRSATLVDAFSGTSHIEAVSRFDR